MGTSERPSIIASSIRKSYGGNKDALRDASLEAYAGEVLGLLGPNGAGKTTFLRIIAGLILNYTGKVDVLGQEYERRRPPPEGLVGGLVDGPGFLPYLTGYENLSLLASIQNDPQPRDLDELAQRTGITGFMNDKYRSYSHGMRQRLGIAASVLGDSPVVLFDEPLDGLDPVAQAEVRSFMTELADAGKTVIISSHRLLDVQRICRRVVLLNHGETVRSGRLDELIDSGGSDVRVSDPAVAVKTLRGAGMQADEREEGWLFVPDGDTNRIVSTLISFGVAILELRPHRESLEDLYVSSVSNGEEVDA